MSGSGLNSTGLFRKSNQARAFGPSVSVQGEFPSARNPSSSQWADIGGGQEVQATSLRNLALQAQGHRELSMVWVSSPPALPLTSARAQLPGGRLWS